MSILTSRPPEWLSDVRQVDEDSLLSLADRLPGEAAEALLELATGGRPIPPEPTVPVINPFEHPDAQRRFRVMSNVEELQLALEFRGTDGRCSSIPSRGSWLNDTTPGPQGFPAPPARGRRLWRCIAPSSWPAPTRMRASC